MQTHEPKWRALIAYDAEALSEAGEARLMSHVHTCDACTEALAQIRAFEHVAAEVRATPLEVNFEGMDLALRSEARRQSQRLRAVQEPGSGGARVAGAMLAVAAAVALAIVVTRDRGEPHVEITEIPGTAVATNEAPAESPRLSGVVVAVAGEVHRGPSAVTLGDAVGEGDTLEVEGHGTLHVRLADGTGFALGDDTGLRIERGREDGVALRLIAGRVSNQVLTGTAYDVNAGEYTVRVRGTHFDVRHDEGSTSVDLEEGTVEILEDGVHLDTLHAPAHWSDREDGESERDPVRTVRVYGEGLATLTLPTMPDLIHWEVSGITLPAERGAALLAPTGPLTIEGFDAEGVRFTAHLELLPEGGALTETDLSSVRIHRGGVLDPEEIAAVVRPSHRSLQRCYERELRRNDPELQGQYTLRVAITPSGAVRSVRVVTSDDLPPPMRSCFEREALGWTFPAPRGGSLTFDLPLSLSARPR